MTHLPLGALLIGGASSRMGRPKQMLPWKGTTLGAYLAGLLAEVTGRPPLLVGAGVWDCERSPLERVADLEAGAGPLSALLGLFSAHAGSNFLVLATDLAAMRPEALEWLLSEAIASPNRVLLPRLVGKSYPEPLAAYYPAAAEPLLRQAWERGVRGLLRALGQDAGAQGDLGLARVVAVPPSLEEAFLNLNTPEAWAALTTSTAPVN